MAILRNPGKNRFTIVNNAALTDDNLSLKARGLLITMLSFPDNWEFSENGLCAVFNKDGISSIRSGLKELEQGGYLVRTRKRDSLGRVSNVDWLVLDCPELENPHLENPNVDNQPQLNTKESNTKEINKEGKNAPQPPEGEKRSRFVPPTVEEVAAYCHERQNHVDPQRFVDFYESKGWMVGRTKMKDWKAAVRTWEKPRDDGQGRQQETGRSTTYSRMNDVFAQVQRRNSGEY